MAPNLDPRASPGSFFRAGSPGSHQIQPSCQKWTEIFRDLGRDFSDFPQMENRGLRWIDLGLGSPNTLFSDKKHRFLGNFWPFPIIWGFPLGPLLGPIGPIGAGGSGGAFGYSLPGGCILDVETSESESG